MCGRCSDRVEGISGEGDYSDNLTDVLATPAKMADDSNIGAIDSKPSGVLSVRRSERGLSPYASPGVRPLRTHAGAGAAVPLRPLTRRYVPVPSEIRTHEQESKHWKRPPVWQYGITTIPERRSTTFCKTLSSLAGGGFEQPILFIDGDWDYDSWRKQFNLPIVCRYPKVLTYGNWILSLAELYIRNPNADFYAIFQDDLIVSKNLRKYLEACPYPDKGYWNLYTFPHNQQLSGGRIGWYQASGSWRGAGAVGLVFSADSILIPLAHDHMVKRRRDPQRGHKYVDGAVVESMNMMGYKEYVHSPSLIQHTGKKSASGNPTHATAPSFRGEGYDLLQLLKKNEIGKEVTSDGQTPT